MLLFLLLCLILFFSNNIIFVLIVFFNSFRLNCSLNLSQLLFSVRKISLSIIFIKEWRNMRREFFYVVPILLYIKKFVKIDAIINPLRLNVLLCLHGWDIQFLSISNYMCNILIVLLKLVSNCASHSKDNKFQGLSWYFSTEVKMKTWEQQFFFENILLNVFELVINFILLISLDFWFRDKIHLIAKIVCIFCNLLRRVNQI